MNHVRLILFLLLTGPLMAQAGTDQSKWDIYLDHAYELTYWDRDELQAWMNDRGNEFGQPLTLFADTWHKKIQGTPEKGDALRPDSGRLTYPEDAYKRLAVAEFLLYLTSQERDRINAALRSLDFLKGKMEKPELAFWYFFIRAHEAIANKESGVENASEQFVRSLFRIWLDIILPREEVNALLNIPVIPVSMRDFSFGLPYLYENLADLILSKAIIQHKFSDTGSLAVIIRGLKDRLSIKGGYADRVNAVVNRMSGPKSDVNHLNFTVIFLEAEEHRFDAQRRLNEEGPSESAEDAFKKSRFYYSLAYKWANTKQGKAAAISDYLNLLSFTYSRLPERQTLIEGSYFAMLTEHAGAMTIKEAIHLFEELTTQQVRRSDWKKHGFSERKDYVTAMNSLWNSITELSLWSAYYHEKGIVWNDIATYSGNVNRSQEELQLCLQYFEGNVVNEYKDVIPDNAYYGAAEAAAKHAHLSHMLAPYSPGMTDYYRAFARLLQYVEIFPYDAEAIMELAQQSSEMGKPELYVYYVVPLAERLKDSSSIRTWKNTTAPEDFISSVERLHRSMPDIILKANTLIYLQSKGIERVKEEFALKYREIHEKSSIILRDEAVPASDNYLDVKNNLNILTQQLASDNRTQDGTAVQALLEEIKKLLREVQDFEEAGQILSALPEYRELTNTLKKDLAQKTGHPVHTLLRRFFHEISPDKNNYHDILSLVNEGGKKKPDNL